VTHIALEADDETGKTLLFEQRRLREDGHSAMRHSIGADPGAIMP